MIYPYAGIDYSMTCPSITVGKNKNFSDCKTFFYTSDKKVHGKFKNELYGMEMITYDNSFERYDNISEWAVAICKKFKVREVCLEGYAMGARGQVFNIAENTGLLKYKLWKMNIEIYTPAPTTVKKYFAGKGNAKKDDMYESFVEKTKVDLETILNKKAGGNPISDIVDSFAMLCYGIDNHFK